MNKNIFIVCAYPNTPIKLDILKDCLRSLKSREGYDILLTTNYKITDVEIYDMVDYLIYDKTDIKSFTDLGVDNLGTGWFMTIDNFKFSSAFDNAYHYDIYRATFNAIGIVNSLGYEFFTYIEGDCVLKDFDKINQLRDRMFSENKKMYFGRIDMGGYLDYCTLLYGGVPSFYLSHTDIPYDVKDWIEKPILNRQHNHWSDLTSIGLEIIIYNCFEKFEETLGLDFFTEMNDVLEYNKIRKIDEYGFNNIFYYDINKPESLYLFLHNNNEIEYDAKFYFNDVLNFEQTFHSYEWTFREYLISDIINTKSKFILSINNETQSIIEKNLTPENIEVIKKTQIFTKI